MDEDFFLVSIPIVESSSILAGRTVGFEIDLDAVKSIDSINSTKRITQSRSTYFYVDTKLMIEQLLDSTMAGPPSHNAWPCRWSVY